MLTCPIALIFFVHGFVQFVHRYLENMEGYPWSEWFIIVHMPSSLSTHWYVHHD